ncbi:hypothetical protein EMIHUDRAFT_353815 [Emiliania huxleyi CCMP1516]|uniref:Uncharacterized protein n=2 Tax=Emiliania huxleyi TaxID=2903 RepID=A0A0D3JUQ5_EMIH1|nr:hypothetical protein EMIHUDRAFT_353815 [Emiliania huxleyi CCMP1516]EOD27240.1 hypothetical protein EMIHUDRAFT_353815 [Emiliania huxleyi CCMP1516]|eukprot:XP_005779669.1 hypothetical protein EMIHUDRAFT_353815 [Emiliania huxleyi CCMP1516]
MRIRSMNCVTRRTRVAPSRTARASAWAPDAAPPVALRPPPLGLARAGRSRAD